MLQNATRLILPTITALLICATQAFAGSLSVSPTRIEVAPNSAQTTMTVKSSGRGQSVVQLRIFGWREGQDPRRLTKTRDVAISPPMARLSGRQELTVRIVRTKKNPVRRRECYRVLVDRLPAQEARPSRIGLRIRHSVPVCFDG